MLPNDLNTSGVEQRLTPDPLGRYVFHIKDSGNKVEYLVRGNTAMEIWRKVRNHTENGVLVNSRHCTLQNRRVARHGDVDFGVYAENQAPV